MDGKTTFIARIVYHQPFMYKGIIRSDIFLAAGFSIHFTCRHVNLPCWFAWNRFLQGKKGRLEYTSELKAAS